MLNFKNQIDTVMDIYESFNSGKRKSAYKRNYSTYKRLLNYNKYESYTKNNYTLMLLFLIYNNNYSSIIEFIKGINNIDDKTFNTGVLEFKKRIVYFKKFLNDDITFLNTKYIDFDDLKEHFTLSENINFYTKLYVAELLGLDDSIINKMKLKRLKVLNEYFSFDKNYIKEELEKSRIFKNERVI